MLDAVLDVPPFAVRVRSPLRALAAHVERFYGRVVGSGPSGFVDFDVEVLPGAGLRRWYRPQARFRLDGRESFYPLPVGQAAPMLEWGLNWCVAQRPLGYAVMHAAVVALGDRALMLPGEPGSGKSTLCASLVLCEGWRLLSDELAILDPDDDRLLPHPRPVGLKNRSIELVAAMPGARLGPIYADTRKGTVAHLACPPASVAAAAQRARVEWLVFPRFDPAATPGLMPMPRAEAFVLLAEQSFNKEGMGERGFDAVCRLLDGASCHQMSYRSTEEALGLVRSLRGG